MLQLYHLSLTLVFRLLIVESNNVELLIHYISFLLFKEHYSLIKIHLRYFLLGQKRTYFQVEILKYLKRFIVEVKRTEKKTNKFNN